MRMQSGRARTRAARTRAARTRTRRSRRTRRPPARVIVPVAIPMALALTFGILVAESGGTTTTLTPAPASVTPASVSTAP